MNEPKTEETIFAATLQLSRAERAAYLHQACGENDALRQRIEVLLNAAEQSGAFLEESAAPTLRRTGMASIPLAEKPGDRIGRYKLLQQIGEGGCGVVYMAEQEEPVHRRVALKVIKLGMDTKQVIARFEAERQALAVMDHPNIAKVLDAGATGTGRPYFVMELVRGIKITEYCDQNNLPTRERLDLFVQVCRAIQHAHQKGIIHRDIKPANILVTLHDGVPVPKVIDFGIAKATQGRLTDRTVFTAFEQFIGTPAYMSPEQAEMSGLDIDTRSDIYSLGVLLYELITGKTPFDTKELLAAGLDAMRRTIREKEPDRPSTRLSTMLGGELSATALHRRSEAGKLISAIRDDLDWIVMKCLEKDRTRRYETANGLVSEIERHLNQEPVLACPPSKLYRLQKLVRRNKLAFAAGSSVAAALAIGLGVAAWMFLQERVALKRAVTAERDQTRSRQRAEDEAAKSRQVAGFLKDTLTAVGPAWAKGGDTTILREILGQTAERVGKELTHQPAVQAELQATIGTVYKAIGEYYQAIGDDQKAETMQRDLLSLRRTMFGATNALVADSLNELAWTLLRLQAPEAEAMAREGLAIRKSLFGNEHASVAESLGALATALDKQGKLAEGEALHRDAVAMLRKLYGYEDFYVALALDNLAEALALQGKLAEAETMYRQALEMLKKVRYSEHPSVVGTLFDLGTVLSDEGKLQEAETTIREALAIRKTLVGDQQPGTANALLALGAVVYKQGKLTEAETMYRKALAIYRKHGDEDGVAKAVSELGLVLTKQGKVVEAETVARGTLGVTVRQPGGSHPGVNNPVERLETIPLHKSAYDEGARLHNGLSSPGEVIAENSNTLMMRGALFASHTRWKEAAADLSRALELSPENHLIWHNLAVVLVQESRLELYREHCAKSIERFGNTADALTAERIAKDCMILPASGVDLDRVARMTQTALRGTNYPSGQGWSHAWCQLTKGLADYRQGHFASAVDWAEKGLRADQEGDVGGYRECNVEAYTVQAMAYHQLNQPDKARAALAKGSELATTKLAKIEDGDLGGGWQDVIIAQVLLREAKALIEGQPVAAKEPGR
jgi:eukaryotic-like serine/threonine-protein kinase